MGDFGKVLFVHGEKSRRCQRSVFKCIDLLLFEREDKVQAKLNGIGLGPTWDYRPTSILYSPYNVSRSCGIKKYK